MRPLPRKLSWIAVLYFAQGFPFGVAEKVWPVYFRVHGVSLVEIGLMSLLFLPYTLKTAWAPLVDRFGSRQAWIAGGELALAAAAVGVLVLDPREPGALLWAVLLAFTVASATQDVAIDGWAVDVTGERETGPVNGVRVALYRAAMIVSGGLLLVVADLVGWNAVWAGTVALFLVLAAVAWRSPRAAREDESPAEPAAAEPGEAGERPARGRPRRRDRYRFAAVAAALAAVAVAAATGWDPGAVVVAVVAVTLAVASFVDPSLLAWAARREMVPVLAFVLLYKLGDSSLARMVEPYWVDRGLSPTEIGLVSTTLGMLLTIGGALAGGAYIARRGIFPALLWFGLAQMASNFGYVVVAVWELPRWGIYTAAVVEQLTQGLGTAAFLSFLMVVCDRRHAATQFALLTATFALSRDLLRAVSGFGVEAWGYATYFTATALVAIPGMLLLPFVRGRIPEEAAPGEAAVPAED